MNNNRSKAKTPKKIPPPPGPEAGYDEIIAYHAKYTLDELEKAGYATEAPPEEVRELALSGEYSWLLSYGLHVKLTRKEYERLVLLAYQENLTADELVKKWIKQRLRQEAKGLNSQPG